MNFLLSKREWLWNLVYLESVGAYQAGKYAQNFKPERVFLSSILGSRTIV